MFICWWKGELIVNMFTSTVTYFFLLLKISLVKKQISCDFLAVSLIFHMRIVSSTRERQSHYEFVSFSCENVHSTTNHMTIFNSCLKVRLWRIETDEIRSNWVKTKTLSWKLPGLVGLQGCRERMISNLTTTEPRYMTVIISSTVNTTLSTAALTTLTHTYL